MLFGYVTQDKRMTIYEEEYQWRDITGGWSPIKHFRLPLIRHTTQKLYDENDRTEITALG